MLHFTPSPRTRLDILNAVQELSQFVIGALQAHLSAMYQTMRHCCGTLNCSLLLHHDVTWDGDPDFEFISGRLDCSDYYAKDPDCWHSVSGYSTFLHGVPVRAV